MEYADPSKLRAYFFGNMYISPIQHGIQAAHVVTKMFSAYGHRKLSNPTDMLYDWADVGVTKILLNGGYQSNLADVFSIFEFIAPKLELPFAKFHEEESALNGALTSVGIVVPQEIYEKVDEKNWLDKDIGMFSYHRPIVSKTPSSPNVQEILASLPAIKVPRSASDFLLHLDLMQTLLCATLRTARLV